MIATGFIYIYIYKIIQSDLLIERVKGSEEFFKGSEGIAKNFQ